jgi:hypothetical protein
MERCLLLSLFRVYVRDGGFRSFVSGSCIRVGCGVLCNARGYYERQMDYIRDHALRIPNYVVTSKSMLHSVRTHNQGSVQSLVEDDGWWQW